MRSTQRKGRPERRSPSRNGSVAPQTATTTGTNRITRAGDGARIVRRGAPHGGPKRDRFGGTKPDRQLKPLGKPRRVRVDVDPGGAPLRVSPGSGAWRGVLSVQERWRIDDEWWRDVLSREYFKVILDDGRLVELYLDRVKRTWYAHGGGSAFADR